MSKLLHMPAWLAFLNRSGRLPAGFTAFALFFLSTAPALLAQRQADISASVTSGTSDYSVTLSWGGIGQVDCAQVFGGSNTMRLYYGCGSLNNDPTCSGFDTNDSHIFSSNPSGNSSHTFVVGPNTGQRYAMRYSESGDLGCSEWAWTASHYATTVPLKNATSVTASSQVAFDYIDLSWGKGSDVPDQYLKYRIYRNNILIATLNGDVRSYRDTDVNPGDSFSYKISTYLPAVSIPFVGQLTRSHEASGVSVTGSTKGIGLAATDGDFHNRVRITWLSLSSFSDEIQIERSVPGSSNYEELAIVNKNATSYSDYDGIPGFNYTYRVTPLKENRTFTKFTNTGYRAPNGIIKGTIKSKLNAGVPGITVTVTVKSTTLTAGASTYGASSTYTATTDSSGVYEIRDIYYYREAEFYVTPSKTNHVFKPVRLTRKLDLNSPGLSSVDFTDETVYTLAGTVRFKGAATCATPDVDILLNGKVTGIKTDSQGNYALAVLDEGQYTITPKFLHHVFDSDTTDNLVTGTRTFSVTGDVLRLNFYDIQKDTLFIDVKNGCKETMGVAQVRITSFAGTCFTRTLPTNASGVLNLVLPAQKYYVEVVDLANTNKANILPALSRRTVDLTVRDTLTETINADTVYTITPAETLISADGTRTVVPADTTSFTIRKATIKTVLRPAAEFTYRGPLMVRVLNFPDPVCKTTANPAGTTLMTRGDKVVLRIEVLETHGSTTCRVDSGMVTIYDRLGDKGVQRFQIKNGEVFYPLTVGDPNIIAEGPMAFQKLFEVFAKVGNRNASVSRKVVVTGIKPLTATFTTRSPQLPLMVLHDPPGDNSYSFLAKDSTVVSSYSSQISGGGEAGIWAELKHGGGVTLPYFGKVGAAVLVNFSATSGGNRNNGDTYTASFTATEQFSTSGSENYVGKEGDVIMGAAMNVIYAQAREVSFVNCQPAMRTTLIWDPTDFATTYIYSEKHIKNVLIPQQEELKRISQATNDQLKVEELTNSIGIWRQVLQKNDDSRKKARFKKNISFSAGAAYDNSITTSKDTTTTFEYSSYLNADFLFGVQLGAGDWNESKFGIKAAIRFEHTVTRDTARTKSSTIGYHLEDDDIGDFFTVDIGEDRTFGTPTFTTKAGTSLCPHEENTQSRNMPALELTSNVASNVPRGRPATFTALVSNLSESGEALEYELRAVPASNLDGAIIRLGGQIINQTSLAVFVPYGASLPMTLTVEPGPFASTYEDLQIMMYPACEYTLWQNGGSLSNADTVTFSAYFQTQCSQVSLKDPGDNWLVKASNNNRLFVVFSNYDASNPKLQELQLEYREAGREWLPAATVPVANLTDQFYGYEFNVSGLTDGKYEIRAKAVCKDGAGFTYSSVLSGVIDRATIAPFGSPSPSDGFLRPGQEISVAFDKNLKPLNNYTTELITLTREDNGALVPVQAAIVNNKLVIKTNPESLITSAALRGVTLTASVTRIQDTGNNEQKYPIEWSFRVEKPVFWDPDTLIASVMIGSGNKIASDLKNSSSVNKPFVITRYPGWLVPSATKGILLPGGSFQIGFAVSNDLKPGIYNDVVEAEVDGVKEVMPVRLELLAIPVAWKVNASGYQYSMNIVAQYTLSALPSTGPLSTDTRDVIGVFVNGVPRGTGRIQPVPNQPGKFAAFITVYSDEPAAGRETLTFRMWHALSGVEYGASQRTPFVLDGSLGSAAAPYVLNPEGIFQVIPLKQGWNSISLNVSTSDMSREKIFSSLLASGNSITIKSQTEFTDFSPPSSWSGTLRNLNLTSSYMVFLSTKPDTLRVVGNPPTGPLTPVPLAGTWNWIGYPRTTNAAIRTALGASFAARTGDLLKSPTAFATFNAAPAPGAWEGNLLTMDPGVGYKLKLNAPASLAYGRRSSDGSEFEVREGSYEYNMTVTAALHSNGAEALDDRYSVGAFINGVCRGFAQPEYVTALKAYRVFMVIHGDAADAGEVIEFRMFNVNSGETATVSGTPVSFLTDRRLGQLTSPYVLNHDEANFENGYFLSQNLPNPFSDQTTIDFTIPREEEVHLTLRNQYGGEVRVLVNEVRQPGNYRVVMQRKDLPSGMYQYVFKSGNYTKTRKLVIIR